MMAGTSTAASDHGNGHREPFEAGASMDGGPVLSAVHKRIRNARKKLKNIDLIQEKVEVGKEINADQVRGGFDYSR
jgi:hypothetical protein